ncbi:MAG: HRDC domain-containing protein, partial [Proteobacteria bacterium]|nr:HRDC domain-containing protein [Pseudomonadota bacterium]
DPNDGRPLVGIGDPAAVKAVFRGERRVSVQHRAEAPAKGRKARKGRDGIAVSPSDQGLFEALRAWRSRAAKAQHVPPYVIFHDRTLAEIAAAKPGRRAALGEVSGVGEGKLARYGEAVLEVVAAFS